MAQLVWLVTGCSSGFGARFIKTIVRRGDIPIATARNINTLTELAELGAKTLQLDVTASPATLDAKVKEAVAFYGRVDVLVQNAGYAQFGAIEETPYEKAFAQFETNTFAVLNLIQSIMPHWRDQQSGYHVLINSQSAWKTDPGTGVYAASKAAANSIALNLHTEVRALTGTAIPKTLIIDPCAFNTDALAPHKPIRDYPKESKHYGPAIQQLDAILKQMHGNSFGSPEKLAEIMVDIVRNEGTAKDRVDPDGDGFLELPVGRDAYERIKKECETMLKNLEVWKDIITATDADLSAQK